MPEITPAQRTATTAKVILGAGVLAWGSAMLRGSVVATVIAGVLLVFGAALLIAARREV